MDVIAVDVEALFDFEIEPEAQLLGFDPLPRAVLRLNDEHDRRGRGRLEGKFQAASDGEIEQEMRVRVDDVHWSWAKKSSNRLV